MTQLRNIPFHGYFSGSEYIKFKNFLDDPANDLRRHWRSLDRQLLAANNIALESIIAEYEGHIIRVRHSDIAESGSLRLGLNIMHTVRFVYMGNAPRSTSRDIPQI